MDQLSETPENLDRVSLEERQLARLRILLKTVMGSNSFWQERLADFVRAGEENVGLESLSDLRNFPLTTKADLVDDQSRRPPYGTNLTFGRNVYSRLHQTSGTTTGTSMRWLDTPESWQWFLNSWAQIFRMVGLTSEDRLCFPFSFGPFIGFWAAFEGANRLGNLCLAGGGMSSQQRLSLITDNQATILCCTPTYALRLAEVAAEQGGDLAAGSVRMLIVAGEPGGSIPSIRSRIESAWGARVIDHWGMTEIGALGVECAENPGGLHILESECIAEIINPETLEPATADSLGVRRGELVVTNLGRLGSPLIRYRTGDLVESDSEACVCGRALLRLKGGILGRADDMITIRGNNVFPSSVEAILREFDQLAEFRIEVRTVRSMHQILLQLEPRPDLSVSESETLAQLVKNTIKDRLNFQPEVQLVEQNSLPRFELKGRRFFRVDAES
ncbi:MAG: phenylacetate--CoA ligase family protein [Planctomycetota bacterium]|nr:phenylacetate--CoA ligase family protein [Planctomycetota bacterium]MDA0920048.1 phenylacetate--CoA ligase family protein [Planctomycetota bacterium]